jgi:putative transcription factor
MVQCEMCGAETASPTTITVEGAELEVCSDCTDFGTAVQTSSTSTSSKYSTGGSDQGSSEGSTTRSGSSSGGTDGGSSGGGGSRQPNPLDEVEELATDYGARIREARESQELNQTELADQLNEKRSLIRKLEREDVLPSDDVQQAIERALDISLTERASGDEDEWSSGGGAGDVTLGDVVERKD